MEPNIIPMNEQEKYLQIEVKDTGVGIDEEE